MHKKYPKIKSIKSKLKTYFYCSVFHDFTKFYFLLMLWVDLAEIVSLFSFMTVSLMYCTYVFFICDATLFWEVLCEERYYYLLGLEKTPNQK